MFGVNGWVQGNDACAVLPLTLSAAFTTNTTACTDRVSGGNMPPNFWTRGHTIYFVPPIFCDKKCCTCTNFVVTLLLKSPSISRGINEKNWHYHWTPKPCRYLSCTQGYIKWIILPRYCQGVCEVQWCKVSHVWQNLNTIPKYTTNNGII